VLGGWQINGNTTFQSGSPLQITGGNGIAAFRKQRPNWNGQNPPLAVQSPASLLRYFNTSDFSFQCPVHFRNAPLLMPNLLGPDGQLRYFPVKNIRILERYQLQFRAESFKRFQSRPNSVIQTQVSIQAHLA